MRSIQHVRTSYHIVSVCIMQTSYPILSQAIINRQVHIYTVLYRMFVDFVARESDVQSIFERLRLLCFRLYRLHEVWHQTVVPYSMQDARTCILWIRKNFDVALGGNT